MRLAPAISGQPDRPRRTGHAGHSASRPGAGNTSHPPPATYPSRAAVPRETDPGRARVTRPAFSRSQPQPPERNHAEWTQKVSQNARRSAQWTASGSSALRHSARADHSFSRTSTTILAGRQDVHIGDPARHAADRPWTGRSHSRLHPGFRYGRNRVDRCRPSTGAVGAASGAEPPCRSGRMDSLSTRTTSGAVANSKVSTQ